MYSQSDKGRSKTKQNKKKRKTIGKPELRVQRRRGRKGEKLQQVFYP